MTAGIVRRFRPVRIAEVRQETEDAVSLVLEPAEAGGFAFVPGQYVTLRATVDGGEVRRSYSICSGLDEGVLRVAVKLVEGGRFSTWAHEVLRAGQVIEAMPPEGRFIVRPDADVARTYLGVAAGSGITPVLSILKSVLAGEPGSRFVLLYGSRNTGGILFRELLEELKDRYLARLSVVHVLSRERQDIPVLNGRLDAEKLEALLPGLGGVPDLALLCGPGGMIRTVSDRLMALGMACERVLSERFALDGEVARTPPLPRPATSSTFMATVISDGMATDVPVRADETVLVAALRAGLDLPYSCQAGMCSTCRARVTEGAVTMDVNYGLEPWETAAGYVLTCQARPASARVVVDYDHV